MILDKGRSKWSNPPFHCQVKSKKSTVNSYDKVWA